MIIINIIIIIITIIITNIIIDLCEAERYSTATKK